jgi:hypothetical protein
VYQSENKKGTYFRPCLWEFEQVSDAMEELRALEREVEREWWWLNGALHAAAQAQAEGSTGDVRAFREMQVQARAIDRRRVQLAVRIAELEAGLNENF